MRYRYFILIAMCLCLGLKVSAQQILTIKGVTSKKLTGERISQVVVSNLRSKDIMMSDDVGWFSIKAIVGDTLLFSKADFTEQKIVITNSSDLPVYMQPVIKLSTVTIQGETKKQELDGIMKDYNRKGIYYNGKPPLASLLLNPLNDLHLLFGKDAADLRRFKADTKEELEYAEIRKRYNVNLVKRVTNASDSTARKFMEYYTPTYQDIKEWNDYELIKHVRASYDFYDKSANKEGLQKLNTPALVKPEKKEDH
jgi:hypothetical protein